MVLNNFCFVKWVCIFLKFEKKYLNLHSWSYPFFLWNETSKKLIFISVTPYFLKFFPSLVYKTSCTSDSPFYSCPVTFGIPPFLDSSLSLNDGVLQGCIFRSLVLSFYLFSLCHLTLVPYSPDLAPGADPCPLMPAGVRHHWQDHPTLGGL